MDYFNVKISWRWIPQTRPTYVVILTYYENHDINEPNSPKLDSMASFEIALN